eukprot:scaffold13485_cov110-Skeletonema_dohrnii-CCMP3373.AAC.3
MNVVLRFSSLLLLLLCCPARTVLAFSPNSHGGICSCRHRLPILSSSSSKFDLPSSDNLSDCNDTLHQSQPFDKTCNQIKSTHQTFQGLSSRAEFLSSIVAASSLLVPVGSTDAFDGGVVAADKDIIAEMGLKQPTEFRPQIRLTEDALKSVSTKSKARTPILQGLVYFPERARDKPEDATSISTSTPSKEPLDYNSDILVLTAVSAKDPSGPILAGAKFPVSSVRFPFSFSMYEQNLLLKRAGVKEAWEDVQNTSDVIIKAYICPSDAVAFPCEDKEVKKYSEGVAKLITELPGLREGEVIRAPASLPLK